MSAVSRSLTRQWLQVGLGIHIDIIIEVESACDAIDVDGRSGSRGKRAFEVIVCLPIDDGIVLRITIDLRGVRLVLRQNYLRLLARQLGRRVPGFPASVPVPVGDQLAAGRALCGDDGCAEAEPLASNSMSFASDEIIPPVTLSFGIVACFGTSNATDPTSFVFGFSNGRRSPGCP